MAHMSCTFVTVTLLLLTSSVVSLNWTNTYSYVSTDLSDATLFLIREHLRLLTSTVVVTERSSSVQTAYKNSAIFDYLLRNIKESMSVQINIVEYTWDYYLFIVDSLNAFKFLISQIPITFNDRLFYFLIILTINSSDWMATMEGIFMDCYLLSVMNVNIIVKHPVGIIYMYTYILFLENRCRVITPAIYFSFDQSLKDLKLLFPRKMKNFFRCPIKVAARIIHPFFNFIGNTSDPKPIGDWENISGFEGRLLKSLAENLNFTIELLPFANEMSYVHEGVGYGSYSDLQSQRADIVIGCFSASDLARVFFSQSIIYYRSRMKHVVRGKILSPLHRLTRPFNFHLWLLISILYFSGSLFMLILKFVRPSIRNFILGKQNRTPMLNFFAVLVGNPINSVPSRNFARFFLMMIILLDLVLRSAYLVSLYEVIRVNKTYAKPPSSYDELIRKNYTFLLPPEIAYLNLHPKSQVIIAMDNLESRMEKLGKPDGNYASTVLHPSFVHYALEAQKNKREIDVLMMEDVYFMFQIAMSFSKRSVLLNIFDKKLREFTYKGDLSRLAQELSFETYKFNESLKPSRVILTVKHLRAIFDILIYFNLIALAVFGLEVLSERFQRIRSVLIWIN